MINNKGHVLAFPDSPIGENAPLNSIAYNKIIDNLKSSVLRCINRTRDISDKVSKYNKALAAENFYLASKVKEMQFGYSVEANTSLVTGYDSLVDSSSVSVNSLTGQITMKPVNKWSKVVRYTDRNGRDRASKDISIYFGTTGSATYQQPDSDIYSMLDGYNDTYWMADTVKGTNYTLRIQFPASIKPYIDYFSLIPFPAFGFSINSIVLTNSDGTLTQIADSISQDMGIVDMHFKPISWGGIVDINITANGSTIGIADIDLGLADYEDSVASMVFEVPAFQGVAFSKITHIDLDNFGLFNISHSNDPGYIKEDRISATVYQGTSYTGTGGVVMGKNTFLGTISNPAGATSIAKVKDNKFYIKFTMQKYQAQTPIFRSVKITYGV